MKFPEPVSIGMIAELISAEMSGNTAGHATGINEIHKVEEGDLVFVDHPKYYDKCINSAASFIIINKAIAVPPGKSLLVVAQPFEAYSKVVKHFRPFEPAVKLISDSSSVGNNTVIFPNAFIGHHVRIGDNCIIYPNVSILEHCVIGNNVIIQ